MHGVVEMAGVPGSKILHLKALWYVIIVTLYLWTWYHDEFWKELIIFVIVGVFVLLLQYISFTMLICKVGNYFVVNIKLKVLKKKNIMLCNYFDKESHTGITFISSWKLYCNSFLHLYISYWFSLSILSSKTIL